MSFIFFAPAYPMPTASKFGFISPFLAGVLFLILLIRLKLGMSKIYLSSLAIIISFFYLALIFFNLISFFLHRNKSCQLSYFICSCICFALFLCFLSLEPNKKNIENLLKVYTFSIFLLCVLTIIEGLGIIQPSFLTTLAKPRPFFGVRMPFKKAVGFNMSDGEWGIMVAPVLLISVFKIRYKNKFPLSVKQPVILLLTTLWGYLVCQSRSGFLALTVAFFLFTFFSFEEKRVLKQLLIVVSMILMIIAGPAQKIIKGMKGSGVYASNVEHRGDSIQIAWYFFKKSPFFGVGHGNNVIIIKDEVVPIHSFFLDQLSAIGIVGFLAGIMLFIFPFYRGLKEYFEGGELKLVFLWYACSIMTTVVELSLYKGTYTEYVPFLLALGSHLCYLQESAERLER
jgi:O-antigen ligase